MGVQFDRILDAFDGPFEKLPLEPIKTPPAAVAAAKGGGRLPAEPRRERRASSRPTGCSGQGRGLLAEGAVHGRGQDVSGRNHLRAGKADHQGGGREARDRAGPRVRSGAAKPAGEALKLQAAARRACGTATAGRCPPAGSAGCSSRRSRSTFEVVYRAGPRRREPEREVRRPRSSRRRDPGDGAAAGPRRGSRRRRPRTFRTSIKTRLGSVTVDKTVPQLRPSSRTAGRSSPSAARRGSRGTSACRWTTTWSSGRSGHGAAARAEKYYVPGSVLQVAVDNTNPLAYGIAGPRGRLLRQQPGVPARSGCGAEGRPAGRLVRQPPRRCGADGPGARAT